MPKAMSTNFANPMMSNCEIVSANVEPPRVNGEPGVTLGVGLGVGNGVAVVGVVSSAGGGVGVEIGAKLKFDACISAVKSTLLTNTTISNIRQMSFLMLPPHKSGCLKI